MDYYTVTRVLGQRPNSGRTNEPGLGSGPKRPAEEMNGSEDRKGI
jgi:hypothetical protein